MKRWQILVFRALIGLLIAASAGLLITARLAKQIPAGLWGVAQYLGGRSGACGLVESLNSGRDSATQVRLTEEMRRQSSLVQSDDHGLSLWRTPLGDFWVPTKTSQTMFYNLAEMQRDIYMTPRKGDVVLDCGANIGLFTRVALRAGAGVVVAIEPAPENLECLRRNFKTEIEQKRVIIFAKGVSDKDGFLSMHIDPLNSARDSFVRTPGEAEKSVLLPVARIDSMVGELALPKVDFVKMDIEGSEREALDGARHTIARYQPRMSLCVYHLPDDPAVIPKLVGEISPGYQHRLACLLYANSVSPEVIHYGPPE